MGAEDRGPLKQTPPQIEGFPCHKDPNKAPLVSETEMHLAKEGGAGKPAAARVLLQALEAGHQGAQLLEALIVSACARRLGSRAGPQERRKEGGGPGRVPGIPRGGPGRVRGGSGRVPGKVLGGSQGGGFKGCRVEYKLLIKVRGFGSFIPCGFVKDMFARMDTDCSGGISFNEWVAAIAACPSSSQQQQTCKSVSSSAVHIFVEVNTRQASWNAPTATVAGVENESS